VEIKLQKLNLDIRELPSIPTSIAEALRVADDDRASSEEIESVVVRDQALTARILRVANSAAFGFPRRVERVREAITILGIRKLKHVVSVMAATELFKGDETELVTPQQLWAHALATSLWARQIIEWKRLWGCGSAVTAALLHDLGILILMQKARENYQPVLEEARRSGQPLLALENRALGTTHAFIGGMLCAKWQLPVSVTMMVCHHHSTVAPVEPALGVVMLANGLAHRTGDGPFVWENIPDAPVDLLGISLDSGPGLEFFENAKQTVHEQMLAFRDAVQT
jgi:HD-like signal output (HDOD) protein